MTNYLILGGGKFGCLALERLGRQDASAGVQIVDWNPGPLSIKEGVQGYQRVQSEAVIFLVQHLGSNGNWDWIIPMVPVHVAFHWLMKGPLAGSDWTPVAVPEAMTHLVPVAQRGSEGEMYLSRAQHQCPDDCAEPETCPITGKARNLPLHEELACLNLPHYQIRVIPSRQLAPGVGGYRPGRLLDLAQDLDALAGNVLIATACRCHGVIHGIARRSGRQSV